MNRKPILAIMVASTLLACKKDLLQNPGLDRLSTKGIRTMSSNSLEINSPYPQYLPSTDYQTLFTDNFSTNNVETNESLWKYRTGQATYNGFTGYNYPANVQVNQNGKDQLYINFKQEADGKYSGGGIYTSKKLGYGYYETRVNLYTATYGLHQSFWTVSEANEIDAFEVDSKNYSPTVPTSFATNRHRWLPLPHQFYKKTAADGTDPSLAHIKNSPNASQWNYNDGKWVTVGWEWLPDRVIVYHNGVKTVELKTTDSYGNDFNVYSPGNLYLTALPLDPYIAPSVVTPLDSAAMRVEYFSYSSKPLLGVNLLGNYSFEYFRQSNNVRPESWSEGNFNNGSVTLPGDVAAGNTLNDPATNNWYLEHKSPNAAAYKANTWQTLSYIPNGKYKLTAKVKCTAHTNAQGFVIQVLDKDRTTVLSSRRIDYALNNWTTINVNWNGSSLYPINVQNNEVTIIIKSDGKATDVLQVDELNFQYTGP